ncbi:MAG: hypothetical protein J4432_03030 [DPANN group archaeon]|nr:hypothetical protein [DPANN group archaeon]
MMPQSLNYEAFMKQDVSEYSGQWIIIINQKVVKHGTELQLILKQVQKEYPKQKPLIARIPSSAEELLL